MNIYNDTTNSLKPQNSKTQKTKLENQVGKTKLENQVGTPDVNDNAGCHFF